MHFLPDTHEADGLAERYWPDSFKEVLRREVEQSTRAELGEEDLRRVYEGRFADRYPSLRDFCDRVIRLIVIGAENGADAGFETVYHSFLTEAPLPPPRCCSVYLWPRVFSPQVVQNVRAAVSGEYSGEEGFQYAHRAGYARQVPEFSAFIEEITERMIAGMKNGVDAMLEKIYHAFLIGRDLPPGRRNPRRLKDW
jgi:hypothetical protein